MAFWQSSVLADPVWGPQQLRTPVPLSGTTIAPTGLQPL